MLLTHIEMKGHKKDTEKIIFYGRNDNGLELIGEDIQAFNQIFNDLRPVKVFALSETFSESKLKEKLLDIQSKNVFSELNIETIKTGNGYKIYAEGNTQLLKKLPTYFSIKPGSKKFFNVELLRHQLGFPFPIIKKHDEIWVLERQMTLEEFLMLNTASLDSEFMHWEKEKKVGYLSNTREQKTNFLKSMDQTIAGNESDDELTAKIVDFFNNNKGKYGIIDKPMSLSSAINKKDIKKDENGNIQYDVSIDKVLHFHHIIGSSEEIEMDLATGKARVITTKSDEEKDMVQKLNAALEKQDIVIYITQNGPKYDLPKLRNFGLEIFGEQPVIKSTAGFFYQTIIRGNIILDLASYSQNYFSWTIDNKYATIVKLITGLDFEKSITYDDQTRLTLEAILGNKESAEMMRKYDVEDVTGMSLTERYILPMVYFKSKIARTSPEIINVTSKANWALDRYRLDNILEGKGFWKGVKMTKYNKFSTFKEFKRLVSDAEDEMFGDEKPAKNRTQKDFTKGALFYIAPFTSIYREELMKNPAIREAFEYLKRPDATPLEKTDMILTIEEGYLMPYIFDSVFKKSPYEKEILEKFIKLIYTFPPINNNDNYFCFNIEDTAKNEFKSLMKGLGTELSRGKLFNIKKGSFILYDGINFYKKDVDAKGKAGFKTIYQSELIHDFIESLFKQGADHAVKKITTFFKDLDSGNLDRNKMIYFKESMIKDYWDYSSPAQKQERVRAYMRLGLKEGDKIAFFKLYESKYVSVEEFEKYPDEAVFGEDMKSFIIEEYLAKFENGKAKMGDHRIGKYFLPLAKYYGISKEEFYYGLISGDHNKVIRNVQYELFD